MVLKYLLYEQEALLSQKSRETLHVVNIIRNHNTPLSRACVSSY